jgi:hypothetical protein
VSPHQNSQSSLIREDIAHCEQMLAKDGRLAWCQVKGAFQTGSRRRSLMNPRVKTRGEGHRLRPLLWWRDGEVRQSVELSFSDLFKISRGATFPQENRKKGTHSRATGALTVLQAGECSPTRPSTLSWQEIEIWKAVAYCVKERVPEQSVTHPGFFASRRCALVLSLHHLDLPQVCADLLGCQLLSRHFSSPLQVMFSHLARFRKGWSAQALFIVQNFT